MKIFKKITFLLLVAFIFSGCAELLIVGGGVIAAGGFIPSGTELIQDDQTGQITRQKVNIWGRVGNTFKGTYESLLGDTQTQYQQDSRTTVPTEEITYYQ